MDKKTDVLAALTLTTPNEQSRIPKSISSSTTESQEVIEVSDDVIYTNHFLCSFARDLTFYQYDVNVEEYHEHRKEYINISNREKRHQFVTDLLVTKVIHPTAVCWYDEGSSIYSTTDFKEKLPIEYEKEEQGYKRRLTIKKGSIASTTNDLNQLSIQIIEILIKQVLKEQFRAIGSVFYQLNEIPQPDGPYDLLTGFKQAICLTESGPTLNLDTTITRFYPHSDLLTFIWERIIQQQPSDFQGKLSNQQYVQICNRLKRVEVTTIQSDHQDKYVLTGDLSDDLPENIFIKEEENLSDYYKQLGYEIQYPQLYCLKAYPVGKPHKLVDLSIEHCSLREWQQVTENDYMKPVPAPAVHKRFRSIMKAIKKCNFHDNELCKEIKLKVNCEGMMAIPYEILNKRQIDLGQRGSFTNPISIDRMGFIYLAERQQSNARQVQTKLLNNFYNAAKRQNMKLPDKPEEYKIFADGDLENNLRKYLSELKKNRCQFILCLENCRDPSIHELFKQIAYKEYGLITQCANFTKVDRITNLGTYCKNLLQSVNAKLSGENKLVTELQTCMKTMFIGADVQHTKNNYNSEFPSFAAVVASMNSKCTVTNQRVSRQWPNKGKQSEEAILLMKTMVEELLIAFKDNNDGALPEHIVFYRDGVDDGQFERVQNEEVADLQKAFQAIYPTGSKLPRLTFIIVKKRHHTRLFRVSSPSIDNVESGVVVDTSIVHMNYVNFFLNSHKPCLGTNKIGSYVVIVNDLDYSLNELEELTYSLCFADQRVESQSSESIPSVVHLADTAASKARQLFGNNTRPSNGDRAEILRVHEDMQNIPNMF